MPVNDGCMCVLWSEWGIRGEVGGLEAPPLTVTVARLMVVEWPLAVVTYQDD